MKMQTFTLMKMAWHPASARFDFDGVRVQTDFPHARISKAYCADLLAHVKRVETEFSKPVKKYAFTESARGKRRR